MYYKAKHIILEDKILDDYFMKVEDGKIAGFTKNEPDEYEDLGEYIAPGLVDTHIHGYKNHDIMDIEQGALNEISKGILENGVTSFLPTTLTDTTEKLNRACALVGKEYKDVEGAKVRGIFLEGPFFTEAHKGAQNADYMSDPDIEKLKKWKELSNGLVNKIAIAPERKGADEFIKKANDMGVYVALGHSDADYDTAVSAVDSGANIFVHVYNGMSGLHHRNPGMVGACMDTKDTIAEMICDGHHVNKHAANIMMDAKGRDHIALITDCMMAGGMPEGDYKLGEFPVKVQNGTARLESGSLAGSILKLNDAVKNVCEWDIADVFEAVNMASLVPAKSVGIDDVCGKLKIGYDADFIALDKDLNITHTYLDGVRRI